MQQVDDSFDLQSHQDLASILIGGLVGSQAAICLCDETDAIRFENPAFRNTFFGGVEVTGRDFVEAVASAIAARRSINIQSMSLQDFVAVARERRKASRERSFSADLVDGRWFWVLDRRLANGWLLTIATEISSIKEEEFKLRTAHALALKASQTDFLTGLANRRCGIERAEAALAELQANRFPLSLAILDIDHFKRINDCYGHDVGDKILLHFAQMLLRQVSDGIHASRIGGEEFLLLMPGLSDESAAVTLGAMMAELRPLEAASNRPPLSFTFSAGIASAGLGESLEAVMSRADTALYAAKANGRARVEINRGATPASTRLSRRTHPEPSFASTWHQRA